jgi:WD40 repeat protein
MHPSKQYHQRLYSEGARFSPDGSLLAEQARPYRPLRNGKFGLTDKELLLWGPSKPGAPLAHLKVAPSEILFSNTPAESYAFSPDGRTLAIGHSYDRSAVDVGDDARVLLDSYVYSVAFNPSDTILATGASDRVELWRLSDRKRVGVIDDIHGSAQQLAFTPDGEIVAAAEAGSRRLPDPVCRHPPRVRRRHKSS